jgi:hypothetical protein
MKLPARADDIISKSVRYCQLNSRVGKSYYFCSIRHLLLMYSRHRFPAEIISYCVWLYYTFARNCTILCYKSFLARISGCKFFQILEIFLVDFCNLLFKAVL